MIRNYLVGALIILSSGCVGIFDYEFDQKITSGYSLGAIDGKENMAIYVKQGEFTPSVIGATVFAIGFNDNFIIAKQHPLIDHKVDKSVVNYYIIPVKNSSGKSIDENKIGPLTEEQFKIQKQQLGFPKSIEFTIVFEDLK